MVSRLVSFQSAVHVRSLPLLLMLNVARAEGGEEEAAAAVAVFVVVRFTTTHQSPRGFRGCR